MADPFTVRFEGSVSQWVLDLLPKLAEAQKSGMLLAAQEAAREVRIAVFNAFPSGRGGLARSFDATLLRPKAGRLRSGAVSDLVYARIQDEGGTIVPDKAKALTIPLSDTAKQMSADGRSARDFPGTLSLIWRKGDPTGLLAESINNKLKPHYLLAKRSRLPGTQYLEKAAKAAAPGIAEIIDASIQKAGDDAKAGGEK